MEKKTAEIRKKINSLIRSLYKENGDIDPTKLKELGLDKEPVYWKALRCYYVKVSIVAYIGGATPYTTKLKDWLEDKLAEEGYDVVVVPEW